MDFSPPLSTLRLLLEKSSPKRTLLQTHLHLLKDTAVEVGGLNFSAGQPRRGTANAAVRKPDSSLNGALRHVSHQVPRQHNSSDSCCCRHDQQSQLGSLASSALVKSKEPAVRLSGRVQGAWCPRLETTATGLL